MHVWHNACGCEIIGNPATTQQKKPKGEQSSLAQCVHVCVHCSQRVKCTSHCVNGFFDVHSFVCIFLRATENKRTNKTHIKIINDYTVLLSCKVIIAHSCVRWHSFIIMCYMALKPRVIPLYPVIFRRKMNLKQRHAKYAHFNAFHRCHSGKSSHSTALIRMV